MAEIPATQANVDVTVIVAAFNAADLIGEAIASALAQEGVRLEVLVVDDSSTDGTADLVAAMARSDPRLRLIRAPRRGGAGRARNLALDQAKGDWIAVLDADDRYQSGRLASLLAVAREWGADMVADNLWLVDASSRHAFDLMLPAKHIEAPRQVSAETFVRNDQPLNIKRKYGLLKPIIRRDLIERHALRYNEQTPYGEDFLLYVECLVRGAKLVLIPQAYYFYELSRTQMTRTTSPADSEAFLDHCDALREREEVRAMPGLAAALSERSEQLRLDLVYLHFISALKQGQVSKALGVLFSQPGRTVFIALHLKRSIALRWRQWCVGIFTRPPKLHHSAPEFERRSSAP